MLKWMLVGCGLIFCAQNAHSASVPKALEIIGQTLIAASKNPEATKDPQIYDSLEKAYSLAERLYNQYPSQMVLVSPGSQFEARYCPNNRYGFAWMTLYSSKSDRPVKIFNFNEIYVCPHAQRVSVNDLAQILLHEIFHSVGWLNECDATFLELTTEHLANRRAHHNAYVYGCGYNEIAEYKEVEYEN